MSKDNIARQMITTNRLTSFLIDTFSSAATALIPDEKNSVIASSYDGRVAGSSIRYRYDPTVNAAYVASHPLSSFMNNGRGFRLDEAVVSIEHLGGGTDLTGAANGAILNAAIAEGITCIRFANNKTYNLSGATPSGNQITIDADSLINDAVDGTPMFTLGGMTSTNALIRINVRSIVSNINSGHALFFKGRVSNSVINIGSNKTFSTSKCLIFFDPDNGTRLTNVRIMGESWSQPTTATVPAIWGDGIDSWMNNCEFNIKLGFCSKIVPFYSLHCRADQSFNYNVIIRSFGAEYATGGVIHVTGNSSVMIEGVHHFDTSVGGSSVLVGDGIYVGSYDKYTARYKNYPAKAYINTPSRCVIPTIMFYTRYPDSSLYVDTTNAANNIVDIRIENCDDFRIVTVGASTTSRGITIDLGTRTGRVEQTHYVSFVNFNSTLHTIGASVDHAMLEIPALRIAGKDVNPSFVMSKAAMATATIPTSVNRITLSGFTVDGDSPTVSLNRVASEPPHVFKMQIGGVWWEGDAAQHGGVPVWFFGALGLTQDEFPAIRQAITAANYLQVACVFKTGTTYVINPNNGTGSVNTRITPLDGKLLWLNGNNATLKFSDKIGYASGSIFHMLGIYIGTSYNNANAIVPKILIENFFIDGNLRGQYAPGGTVADWVSGTAYTTTGGSANIGSEVRYPAASQYIYRCITANSDTSFDVSKWSLISSNFEQWSAIKISSPTNGGRINDVVIRNINVKDKIASAILIGPSSTDSFDDDNDGVSETAAIKRAFINNVKFGTCLLERSGISIGSGVSNTTVSNCYADPRNGPISTSMEVQFSSIGTQKVVVNLIDVTMDTLEVTGAAAVTDPDRLTVNGTNCTFRDYAYVVYSSCDFTDCRLPIGSLTPWRVLRGQARGCIFTHYTYDTGSGLYQPYTLYVRQLTGVKLSWRENSCEHNIVGTVSSGGTNAAIQGSQVGADQLGLHRYNLDNCHFDPLFARGIFAYGGGEWRTTKCRMAGTSTGVLVGALTTLAGRYISMLDNWTDVTGNGIAIYGSVNTTRDLLRITGGTWNNFSIFTSGSYVNDVTGLCTRVRQVSAAPTGGGIANDTAILDPVAYSSAASGAPIEWRAYTTSSSNANWVVIRTKP